MPGPGPRRGGFRPHQKVENPSLLLKRIISILFKSHPILLIISYICLISPSDITVSFETKSELSNHQRYR